MCVYMISTFFLLIRFYFRDMFASCEYYSMWGIVSQGILFIGLR